MNMMLKKTTATNRTCILFLFLSQAALLHKAPSVLADDKKAIVELYQKKRSIRNSAANVFDYPWRFSNSKNDSAYFTPSGKYLVTSSYPEDHDNTSITKWNLRSGILEKVFIIDGNFIDQIQVSNDDKWMIVTTKQKHKTSIWNFQTGEEMPSSYNPEVDDLHFFGSSSDVLWHKHFDEIKTIGVQNRKIRSTKLLYGKRGEISYGSNYGHSRLTRFHKDQSEYLIRSKTQTLLKVHGTTGHQREYDLRNTIQNVCASDDLSRIAVITDRDEIEVVDGKSGESVFREEVSQDVELVGIHRDGQELFLLGPSGSFESRGVHDDKKIVLSDLNFNHSYQCYAFSKDFGLLACGVGNGRFDLIDTQTGARLIRFFYLSDSNSWQCESFDGFVIRSLNFLGSIDDEVVENPRRIKQILELLNRPGSDLKMRVYPNNNDPSNVKK